MKKQAFCVLCILGMMPIAYADAPVEDYSTEATTATTPIVNTTSDTATSSQSHWQEQKKEGKSKNQETSSLQKPAPINIPDPTVATNASTSTSSNTTSNIDTSNLSLEQRIKRLEQQTNYLNKNNPQSQLEDLRQKLEKVSGDLDAEQHKVEQLEKQLTDFYTDLDQRLKSKSSKTKESTTETSDSSATSTKNDITDDDTSKVTTKPTQVNKKSKPTKNLKKTAAQITSDTTVTTNISNNASTPTDGTAADSVTDNKTNNEANNSNLSKKEAAIKEQQSYHAAFDYLQNRQFNEGAKKLKEYLAAYPTGAYAANAHYWLGEIYFLNNAYPKANNEFATVISKYSSSPKIPEALFKLAYIHDKEGKHEQAQKEYRALKKRFPNSAAAKLADQQLQGSATAQKP